MLSLVLSLKETPYWNILSVPLSPKCAVLFSSFNSQDLIVNSCLQLLCKPRKLHVVRGIWF